MGGALKKSSQPAGPRVSPPTKKTAVVITEKDRTILQLKMTAKDMRKYQRGLEEACASLLERAKGLAGQAQQQNALNLMRLRARKLQQIALLDGQVGNILQVVEQVEMADINKDVYQCLRQGAATLKQLNDEMPIEEVQRILQDTREALDLENEISSLLGAGFSTVDKEALEKQLEELMQPTDDAAMGRQQVLNLPSVPSHPVVVLAGAHAGPDKVEEAAEEQTPRMAI